MDRLLRSLTWPAGIALTLALPLAAQTSLDLQTASVTAPAAGKPSASDRRRFREGTQIDNVLGRFKQNGETASFLTNDGLELGGLPNLNLQRVLRTLKTVDEPESVWWSISGTVTEFDDRNYVLISRAVYKAAAPPPIPEQISAGGAK
jgi:hypothetical protein